MRRVGQTRRRDANEDEIVATLTGIGLIVYKVSGPGMPDLLVYDPWACRRGEWIPIEVKTGTGKLTPAQIEREQNAPCPVVRNAAEAAALFVDGRPWLFERETS